MQPRPFTAALWVNVSVPQPACQSTFKTFLFGAVSFVQTKGWASWRNEVLIAWLGCLGLRSHFISSTVYRPCQRTSITCCWSNINAKRCNNPRIGPIIHSGKGTLAMDSLRRFQALSQAPRWVLGKPHHGCQASREARQLCHQAKHLPNNTDPLIVDGD